MPIAELGGQPIYFEDSGGDGPAIILSHGFLMSHAMFAPQVAALSPRYRVITFDARGFGNTPALGPFTYWDNARDAFALLDHLGVDEAVFGGMSQGGFLSLRAALLAPRRVRAIVLFSSAADLDDEMTVAGYRMMMQTWLANGPVPELSTAIASIILGDRAHFEPWVSQWPELSREGLRHATECLLSREDLTPRLGEISCPALQFHGTQDSAISMARAEKTAAGLKGLTRFVKVEGAAHATNLTHPDQVNPPLVAFVDGL